MAREESSEIRLCFCCCLFPYCIVWIRIRNQNTNPDRRKVAKLGSNLVRTIEFLLLHIYLTNIFGSFLIFSWVPAHFWVPVQKGQKQRSWNYIDVSEPLYCTLYNTVTVHCTVQYSRRTVHLYSHCTVQYGSGSGCTLILAASTPAPSGYTFPNEFLCGKPPNYCIMFNFFRNV